MSVIVSHTPATLADAILPRHLIADIAMIAGGASATGLAAQVVIPLWPVPITGQTLAVLVVAASLGALRASLSMGLYIAAGILGVPWFSDGSYGLTAAIGPTGGYLIGFILAAAITGWLAERHWDRRALKAAVAFSAGSAAVFAVGLPWLGISLHLNLQQTLEAGLYPFIAGGAIKALVAAGLIRASWALVDRAAARRP